MSEQLTYRQAIQRALLDAMADDKNVILFGEDVEGGGAFGITNGMSERFGKGRVFNMPISESAFLGMAIGAAMTGQRPIVEIMFSDFLGVCFDGLLNQMSKFEVMSGGNLKVPLLLRTTTGAGLRAGGQHSASLYHLLAGIEGLDIFLPSNANDAYHMTLAGIRSDSPTVIFEHKTLYDDEGLIAGSISDQKSINVSEADLTIVATSAMVKLSQLAVKALHDEGINAVVIDMHTINPFDVTILDHAALSRRILVVDEGPANWGVADKVAAYFASKDVRCLAVTSKYGPTPAAAALEDNWRPTLPRVIERAKQLHLQGR